MNKMRKSEKGAEKVMKYVLFHCFYGNNAAALHACCDVDDTVPPPPDMDGDLPMADTVPAFDRLPDDLLWEFLLRSAAFSALATPTTQRAKSLI